MKLWQKDYSLNKEIEKFTVGNDNLIDEKLVPFDCIASIAHAKMLKKIGILKESELKKLIGGLNEIIKLHTKGQFKIKLEDEDCHTAIENFLVKKYGNVGKKIHTARSRNDQVLAALRLYEKQELIEIRGLLHKLNEKLESLCQKYKNTPIPGYTHMQKAMPTKINVWFGCFISSVSDDIGLLEHIYKLINQSPLGSAAGFGIPVLNVDKKLTADLMGFSKIIENPLYVQLSRSKFEASIAHLLGQILFNLNKLSTDLILFSMKEFGYVILPDEFCTGSSIMPQKKNPDVLELIRAKYHVILGEEFKIKSMVANLMSGYNRDIQLTKEPLMKSIETTKSCLQTMCLLLEKLKINEKKCKEAMSNELYATKEVYKLVKHGVPFREAYKKISKKYQNKS